MNITCGGCEASWTGESRCHCSGCHQLFGGLRAFDKHRVNYQCHEPASRGLVNNEGIWSQPAPTIVEEIAA